MLQRSAKIKLGGGGVNTLNESTILYGKGYNVTEINYDNITVNPLNFVYPLSLDKIYYNTDLSSNEITFDTNIYYYKSNVDELFQRKLIADYGIVINTDSNISVDFSKSGWTCNVSNIYSDISYIGIGTNKPVDSLHIKTNNAAIIIDNNINKFKFANVDNYFSFGNNNGHNEIIETDYYFKEQFKIHRDSPSESLVIDYIGNVNINCNINVNNETYLTDKIYINNLNLVQWLGSNGLATAKFVESNINFNSNINKIISNLDYNNITQNRLNFIYPLSSNILNNNITVDLTAIGWVKTVDTIFSDKSSIGIGTNQTPHGLVHIGSLAYSAENPIINDGSLVLSKSTSQNNISFKLGFDDNFNFIFGNINSTIWNSPFVIYNSAPNNSLFIDNSGNININNSLNINSNINVNGSIILNKFNINYSNNNFILGNSLLFLNNDGFIGIGTNPDNIYRFTVNGHIKTNNNFYGNDIFVNNGTFLNINLNSINVFSNINTSNLITSNIRTNNLNNTSLISTRNLLTSNLITSTNINTSNLNVFTNFITANINTREINSLNINNLNNITTDSLISSKLTVADLTTTNANIINLISPNIYSSENINCDNNITSTNVYATNLEITNKINTNEFVSSTITTNSLNAANNISTLNISSTNLTSSNINTNQLNVNNNITTALTTSTSVNAVTITTTTLNASDNITANNIIYGNVLNANRIVCTNQIALNVINPISEIHIGNSSSPNTNPSFMISYNNNNFKIGYDNSNNFIFGDYSRNTLIWTNQLSINRFAPANTININSIGNIGIGKRNEGTYKIDIDGTLNATRIFQNNEQILNTTSINNLITNNLVPYITSNRASSIFSSITYVNELIDKNVNYLENTITKVLVEENSVYTTQKRYPIGIYNTAVDTVFFSTTSNIYGIKEDINESIVQNNETLIKSYEIYSSSTSGIGNKKLLFNYTNTIPTFTISWGLNNYLPSVTGNFNNSTFNPDRVSSALKNSTFYNISSSVQGFNNNLYGDYIVFKFDEPIILTKFVFYILTNSIQNAPGNWICIASNDSINWTYIINASTDLTNQLTRSSYSRLNDTISYYEKIIEGNDTSFLFYGFIFNQLILTISNPLVNITPGTTLQLSRIELFGKTKLESVYVTNTNLNNILTNYSTIYQLNQKLNKNITFTPPLIFNENTQTLTYDALILTNATNDAYLLSNLIVNYIQDQTSTWKIDTLNNDNIYYSFTGCVGIGSTSINTTNINDLKLDIHGRIRTSNINVVSTVNANSFIGNGSLITNINYNNIIANKPDLKNLNNWNIDSFNNIYAINSGNIGIGYNFGNFLSSKLSVNGNVLVNGNINATTISENNVLINNKYLTISTASDTYFRNVGGFISGTVGINTSSTQNYMLNVNGDINGNIINAVNLQENGINLSLKYINIIDANNNYLSKITGGIVSGNVIINSNLAIGTSVSSIYRLNILGSLYSSSNIVANNNFIENGSSLIDKYLMNSTASQVFLSNIGGVISNNLTINSNLGIGITASSLYNLNINGNLNATSIYINNNLIDFNSYAIKTDVDTKFTLYATLNYLNNNFVNNSTLTSTISQYTKTGLDTNYLNITNGGTVIGLTNFINLNSSNINSSNLNTIDLNSSNLFSSNINVFNLNVGSTSLNPSYSLNVNGSFNATSIYNNNNLINFDIYAIKTDIDTKFTSYATLNYLNNNFVNNSTIDSRFNLYSTTGNDPNYLKLSGNGMVSGNVNFNGSLNTLNISNTSNINSSNINTSNLFSSNIAINTNISTLYPLNVNGSIYSSNNIICAGNFNENGVNLINKYLTITNANNNYLSNIGGVISGNLGIGTSISSLYRLTINGSIYSSNNIICASNINEGGINLIDKYLTITNATQNYLSLNGGTIRNNLTINNNLGIGINATSAYKLFVNGTIYCNDTISENGILLANKYLSLANGGSVIGNIGIGTSSSQSFKLNVNGSIYSSNDIRCAGNLNEGGVNLVDKYLTIANASQYLITGDFLNNQPNLQKKIGFKFVCSKPIILNNETYYKHDIYINQYVKNKTDPVDMSNYRIFNIKCFSTIGIFTTMTANKPPNILQYDVYMSSFPSVNICAIGFPSNYYLNKITAGDICLLKTTNFNYISVVSKTINNSISCIISDFLF